MTTRKQWVQLFGFLTEKDRGLLSVKGIAIDPTDDNTAYFLADVRISPTQEPLSSRLRTAEKPSRSTMLPSLFRFTETATAESASSRLLSTPIIPTLSMQAATSPQAVPHSSSPPTAVKHGSPLTAMTLSDSSPASLNIPCGQSIW